MSQAKGWRSIVAIAAVVGGIGVATYPIIVAPYMDPQPWQDKQKVGRVGMDREKIQPGGMKVWTDPFSRKDDQ